MTETVQLMNSVFLLATVFVCYRLAKKIAFLKSDLYDTIRKCKILSAYVSNNVKLGRLSNLTSDSIIETGLTLEDLLHLGVPEREIYKIFPDCITTGKSLFFFRDGFTWNWVNIDLLNADKEKSQPVDLFDRSKIHHDVYIDSNTDKCPIAYYDLIEKIRATGPFKNVVCYFYFSSTENINDIADYMSSGEIQLQYNNLESEIINVQLSLINIPIKANQIRVPLPPDFILDGNTIISFNINPDCRMTIWLHAEPVK